MQSQFIVSPENSNFLYSSKGFTQWQTNFQKPDEPMEDQNFDVDFNFMQLIENINKKQGNFTHTFEQKDLLFQLCLYLPTSDIMTKVALLNKNFNRTINDFKGIDQIWYEKIQYEWINDRDIAYQLLQKYSFDTIYNSKGHPDYLQMIEEHYPLIKDLIIQFKDQNEDDKQLFNILKYGISKEKKTRQLFKELIELTEQKGNYEQEQLVDLYMRPYQQRRKFYLKPGSPKELPFEIYSYFRSYNDINDVDPDMGWNVHQDEFFIQTSRFDSHEMLFSLEYPEVVLSRRTMIKHAFGNGGKYDYLPLIHPVGMPQSLMMDYTNFNKLGNTCLYLTGYCPIYWVYVAPSWIKWMENHIYMLQNNFFQIDKNGAISNWLDLDQIYKEYISNAQKLDKEYMAYILNSGQDQNDIDAQLKLVNVINDSFTIAQKEFTNSSCTIKDGFQISIQAKYENMRSEVVPDFLGESSLFFHLYIELKTLEDLKSDESACLESIEFNLTWNKQENGDEVQKSRKLVVYQKGKFQSSGYRENTIEAFLFNTFQQKQNAKEQWFHKTTDTFEHNQRLFVNQLGIQVDGTIIINKIKKTQKINDTIQDDEDIEEKIDQIKIEINEFWLNMPKGWKFVKNPLKEEVWGVQEDSDNEDMSSQ